MQDAQRAARLAGALYLVTFVTSIPALALKEPLLDNPAFVLGPTATTGLRWASVLEVVLALACVGTAVVLFSLLRRQSEAGALGFAAARIVEAAVIAIGVVSLLAIVTLHDEIATGALATPDAPVTAAASLLAVHDWAFLVGPGFIPAVNALCLGYVLFRSGLVPRLIPLVGLIGAPLLAASAAATVFGLHDQVSSTALVAALPIAAWELSLGLWLVARGFHPNAVHRLLAQPSRGAVTSSPAPA